MLNQIVMVGRFTKIVNENTIEVKINSNDKDLLNEYYFINITVADEIMKNIKSLVKENSVIGIKAFIKSNQNKEIEIKAEKISFLSPSREV